MKKSILITSLLFASTALNAQTVIVDENFESYTANQQLAQQSNLWETWSSANGGGSDDALVSSNFALSGTNSMLITHDKDMILPIGNYNSGHFIIEFNAYMIEQAYFNIMHTCKSSWAFDLYITSSNEIVYLDEPNAATNNVTIDTYSNDQWVNFRFDIDIDQDSVTTYINNVQQHQSVFSNAVTGSPGNGLTCINFFGLDLFNGVDNSNYHIDDILITQLNTSSIEDTQLSKIQFFPNPSDNSFEIISDEPIEKATIYNLLGEQIAHLTNTAVFDVSDFENGVYQVVVETSTEKYIEKIVVQH